MRRVAVLFVVMLLLVGCTSERSGMEQAILLREKILSAESCSFQAVITADYGESIYTFTMDCVSDRNGDLRFCVIEPDSIEGICGNIAATGGKLTFDDQLLSFFLLADGEISPISGPWHVMKALRGGYLRNYAVEDTNIRLTIDDSFEADSLQTDIWLNENGFPIHADLIWQGRRIIAVSIENFQIL